MEIIYKLLVGICLLSSMLVSAKRALHMFQQNRYELPRYGAWLKERKIDRQDIVFFLIANGLWLIPLLFPFDWLIVAYLAMVGSIVSWARIARETNIQYIKPLKYTGRVQRQIVAMALLNILWIILWLTAPIRLWPLAFVVASLVNGLLIYPMYWMTEPFERAVRRHYINQAKEILASRMNLIKIGITGSYGKTSSKNILQAVLSDRYYSLMTPASFNTPMGITITIREMLKPLHEVFICEMGADKVGEIDELTRFVKPRYGVVTSIGPQHLSTFGSLENIIQEKMKMIENLPPDGVGFINKDNGFIRNYQIKNSCRIVSYGIQSTDVDYQAMNINYSTKGSRFIIKDPQRLEHAFETRLLGEHNIMNILAAVAVGREMGIQWEQLVMAVKGVDYIEHRLEVKVINGLTFIDNAFNSNPEGAAMSLEVLGRMDPIRYIVTPGMIDLGDQQDRLNREFGKQMLNKADVVVLVGKRQTAAIFEGLRDVGFDSDHIKVVDSVKDAFDYIYQTAKPEDTILLENDLPDAFNR